jgi:hydrogenase maturation protease
MRDMPRLTVIGIGSPFADDQAGWRVVQSLAASSRIAAYGERVTVASCRSPGGELLNLLANTDTAIVVDAVRYCGAPGTLYRLWDVHSSLLSTKLLSSHGLDMGSLFGLAAALECRPKQIIVYGIESGPDNGGVTMCQSVRRTVDRVIDEIKREIDELLRIKNSRFNAENPADAVQ